MGACWHDYDPDDYINTYSLEAYVCRKCKNFILGNNDFSTEEDFLKLWKWAHEYPALKRLVGDHEGRMPEDETGRNAFADTACAILSSP